MAPEETPIVIWRDRVLRRPSNAELAEAIGLRAPYPSDGVCDLVVVGAGPEGLAASVYGATEGQFTACRSEGCGCRLSGRGSATD